MKIIRLTRKGTSLVKAYRTNQGWKFEHGMAVFTLHPSIAPGPDQRSPYRLRRNDLDTVETSKNKFTVIEGLRIYRDHSLVLWDIRPGKGGQSFHGSSGHSRRFATTELDGVSFPVMKVAGSAQLWWERTGRLYGTEPSLVAVHEDGKWLVCAKRDLEAECRLRGWYVPS